MNERQANAARWVRTTGARWTGRIGAATLALAASVGAASAQYYEMQIERPRVYDRWDSAPRVYRMEPAPVSPGRAVGALLARHGYRAAGPAVRNGDVFIVPAEDRRGRRFRMVLDIYEGEILERFAMAGPNTAPRPPRAIGRARAPDDDFAPVERRATRDLRAPETRGLSDRDAVASRPLPLPDESRLAPGAGPGLAPDDGEPPRATPRRAAEPKAKPAPKPAPRQAKATPPAKPEALKPDTAEAETSKTDVTKPDVAKTETGKTETGKTEAAKTEAAKTEAAKPEAPKPQTAKSEPAAKPEPAVKPDVAKAAPAKAEDPKPMAAKPVAPKPETARVEPAKPAATPGTKPMANSSILRRPSAKADDSSAAPKTQSAEAGETGTRRAPRVVYPGPGTTQPTPSTD